MTKYYGPGGLCFETGTPDPEEARLQREAWEAAESAIRSCQPFCGNSGGGESLPNATRDSWFNDNCRYADAALRALDAYRAQHRDEALVERMASAFNSARSKPEIGYDGLRAVLALLRKEGRLKEPHE